MKADAAAAAKAAKAPKKQKLTVWIDATNMGAPAGLESDETVLAILAKFEGFKKWAKEQVNGL